MAKKIHTIWERVNDYSKKHQSGLNNVSSFNGKINEAITELINYLFSIHAINERATELLQPYIKSATLTGSSTAVFSKPLDFNYYLSASFNGKPIHKVAINQLDTYEQLEQRRGDLSKSRVNITGINNGWEGRPVGSYNIRLNYVFEPEHTPAIVFAKVSTDDEDRLEYNDATTIDFLFDKKCIPLLTYMVLEKFGIEIREDLLSQYSQLGISKEQIKQP